MILTQLRDYLKQHGRASVLDMAYRFDVEPDTIRGMLAHWIKKDMVEEFEIPDSQCNGCSKCDDKKNEIYRWAAKTDCRPR